MKGIRIEYTGYQVVGATWVIYHNGVVIARCLSERWARTIAERLGKN